MRALSDNQARRDDMVPRRGMTVRVRLFIMMALQLGITGACSPKLFPYMTKLGFSAAQQGLIGSSFGIAAVVGLFFSNQFADRNFAAERFLAFNHAVSGACLLGVAWSTSFVPFAVFYLLYSLIYVPTLSVANALAFANLSDPAREFGAVRVGGTIGWILASWPFLFLLGAKASVDQIRSIFVIAAILSFALSAFSLWLPHTPPQRGGRIDPLAWRSTFSLLRKPFVAVLFIVTFIDSVTHSGYFVVVDAFLTDRVGIPSNVSMVVMSVGQMAEMLTMLVLGRVLVQLGWRVTMIIGVLGHALRFLIFALAADSLPTILLAQLLHGICYAFFFAAVYIFADEVFPPDLRTSAQGLFNFLILGAGMVVASVLFPALISTFTYTGGPEQGAVPVVDYSRLFMVPVGLSMISALLLAFAFHPPTRGPVDASD